MTEKTWKGLDEGGERASIDQVAARYPLASFGYIPEFSLVGQFGNLFLYEVAKSDN
jgi:hypothetical protein